MKQAILTLLANIMYSLKEVSANYHSLMLPLIRSSLDPNSVCFPTNLHIFEITDQLSGRRGISHRRGSGALVDYYVADPSSSVVRDPVASSYVVPNLSSGH